MYLNFLRRYPALVLLASSFGIAASAYGAQTASAPTPLAPELVGTKCDTGSIAEAPGPKSCSAWGSNADITTNATYLPNGLVSTMVIRGSLDSTNGIPSQFRAWWRGMPGNSDFIIPGPRRKILIRSMSISNGVMKTIHGTLGSLGFTGMGGFTLINLKLTGDGEGKEWSTSTPASTGEVMSDQVGALAPPNYAAPHTSNVMGLSGMISTGQAYESLEYLSTTQFFEMDGATPITITVLKNNGNGPKK